MSAATGDDLDFVDHCVLFEATQTQALHSVDPVVSLVAGFENRRNMHPRVPGVPVAADAAVAHEDCGSIVSSKGEPCVHNKSSTGDSSCPVA
ncbi:MAG: hypothetical protein ACI91O_001089 [Candidatus Poriferisodalaceae bacterium]